MENPEKLWESVITKPGMGIYKKYEPPNPCVMVRAEALIKGC